MKNFIILLVAIVVLLCILSIISTTGKIKDERIQNTNEVSKVTNDVKEEKPSAPSVQQTQPEPPQVSETNTVNPNQLVRCATHPTDTPRNAFEMEPVVYKGKTYFVCCKDCVTLFNTKPESFVNALNEYEKSLKE